MLSSYSAVCHQKASASVPGKGILKEGTGRPRPATAVLVEQSDRHANDDNVPESRPKTVASGVQTRAALVQRSAARPRLPKHMACLTTPRDEEKTLLQVQ